MTRPPGQSEARTVIAWGRTALAAAALAVLLLRLGVARHSVAEILAGLLALITAAGFGARGRASYLHPIASVAALRLLTLTLAGSGAATVVALL